jgi:DNA polymerase-3 subunit beta
MLVLKTRKDTLLKPLQAAVGVVERKHTLPILSNVLIEAHSNRVAFVATDLELQITTWMDEEIASQTSVTVSARKLLDICRSLSDSEALSLEQEGEQLRIKSGKSRFNLVTLPAKDFPKLQIADGEGISFSLPQGRLRHLLGRVQYAMAVQDIRYYLNGMLLSLQGDRLIMAATDGHRLAVDATTLEQPPEQGMDIILPRKTALELIKLLGDDEEPVHIQMASGQVVIRHPQFELRSKVVDGKFPDWQRVVPSGYEMGFQINRQQLSHALNRAAILTNEKYRGVRLALTSGSLRIACSNNEQEEAQEELDIDYNREPLDIGFNIQYLQDALNNLDADSVECAFGDPTSSMLITLPGEANFRYVVMPMRI